jgi:hypothetical protein
MVHSLCMRLDAIYTQPNTSNGKATYQQVCTAANSSTWIAHVQLERETNNYDSKTRDSDFEIIGI